VRRTLAELPESLDETYERVLKEIKKPNRDHAHRILQCLVVSVRPLRVKELAEVVAIDFDDSSGVAKLKPNWRWEDEEQALLSSCSSLITIVGSGKSRVVQFSHFSVKEYLTSPRFGTSSQDVPRYYIALEPAHTTLAQACLSILLRLNEPSPLTGYAARHWVTHAKFKNTPSHLRKAMESLFDLDNRYFAAWRKLHDIDRYPDVYSTFFIFCPSPKLDAAPLYYAALCGFHSLTEHLIAKYPQQVIAYGGIYATPLVAALAGGHFGVAELLLRHGAGATVNVRSRVQVIPLHSAAYYGDVEMVRFLLKHNADVHYQDIRGWTPLHFLGEGISLPEDPNMPRSLADVARLLLDYGADINARANNGSTPLHIATSRGMVEAACVLLEHGANADERDDEGRTVFQIALEFGDNEVANLLLERGASSSL